MNSEQKERILDALDNADFDKIESVLSEMSETNGVLNTIEPFCQLLILEFYHSKDESLAVLIQQIIESNQEFAEVRFPGNPIFQLAFQIGAFEIYKAYLECYVLKQDEEKQVELLLDLVGQAEQWKEMVESNYEKVIVGRDYNGPFSTDEETGHTTMHLADFQTMDTLGEHYNSIVGRWEILRDLGERI